MNGKENNPVTNVRRMSDSRRSKKKGWSMSAGMDEQLLKPLENIVIGHLKWLPVQGLQ